MKNWTRVLTRPYLILTFGVVVGGVVVASVEKAPLIGMNTLKYVPIHKTISYSPPTEGASKGTSLADLDAQYTQLSEYVGEAVVHIHVDPQYRGRFMTSGGGDGSGFILTTDGWIVTNDHVVGSSKDVKVILSDGRELDGKVSKTGDPNMDIAMVKIDAQNLRTLHFANSDGVKPGQIVIAAGAPFGLENSITFGHVSAISRPGLASDGIGATRYYAGMIQTDAAINPGNSGGPLVDIDGNVVGVNTSIYSTSGASAGIGFAIPANVVQVVSNELIKTGKFDRGMMGIVPRNLKPYEQKEKGIIGAYVDQVNPGDPADKSGIKVGDVITSIDGVNVRNETDLRVELYKKSPNDKVTVVYDRDGKDHTTSMVLTKPTIEQPQQPQLQLRQRDDNPFDGFPNLRDLMPPQPPTLGVTLNDLDDTMRTQYNLPGGVDGAVIVSVKQGSPADKAGLEEGDVITAINGNDVKSGEEIAEVIQGSNAGDTIVLRTVRVKDGKAVERTLHVKL
ncbi:MAG TPA: PDZ domain-containing protein [Fimbriimonadaceae bacterium]|nr:PDZ domain-containing protein [Fimbriimonadaceae bacterium]